MVLGNERIKKLNLIKGINLSQLQPASYDLTLNYLETIDGENVKTVIKSGETLLATTLEKVELPKNVAGFIKDKSSFLRLGLTVGQGYVDPGFKGNLTISIFNGSDKAVELKSNKPFCQIVFLDVKNCSSNYNGHYQNSTGVTKSIFEESDETIGCLYGEISD